MFIRMIVLCAAMFLMSANANAALSIDVTFLNSPAKGDLQAKGSYTDAGYTYEVINIYYMQRVRGAGNVPIKNAKRVFASRPLKLAMPAEVDQVAKTYDATTSTLPSGKTFWVMTTIRAENNKNKAKESAVSDINFVAKVK